MVVPGKAGEDLLLVSSEACKLLDGQDLAPRWTLSAAQVLRYGVLLQEPVRSLQARHPQPIPLVALGMTLGGWRAMSFCQSLLPVTWCCPVPTSRGW